MFVATDTEYFRWPVQGTKFVKFLAIAVCGWPAVGRWYTVARVAIVLFSSIADVKLSDVDDCGTRT